MARHKGVRRRWPDGSVLAGHRHRAAAACARCCMIMGSPTAALKALGRSVRHRAEVAACMQILARSWLQCSAMVGLGGRGVKERLAGRDMQSSSSVPSATVLPAHSQITAGAGARHRRNEVHGYLSMSNGSWIVLVRLMLSEQCECTCGARVGRRCVAFMRLTAYERNV
mmetsp:Transcript_29218/g.75217  ORF Transcript_29218/g.75217 Transcript_29218/m.75217 type:complete len:169 (-) Transcript_29218:217-723(-)